MSYVPQPVIEAALAQIDAHCEADDVAVRFDRAQLLEFLGRSDEATREYVWILGKDPLHIEALNALGVLFVGGGHQSLARTMLSAAVAHGPAHAAAHANLAYIDLLEGNLEAAAARYATALQLDSTLAIAHHGLAQIAERRGDRIAAAACHALGLRHRPITISRYTGSGRPIHILALGTADFGNLVTDGFFDTSIFLLASVIVEYVDPTITLPPHDIVFNIIGEGDLCAGPLLSAAAIIERTAAPVLNAPSAVAATGRAANARRLGQLPGVITPRIEQLGRELLMRSDAAQLLSDHGFTFPLLVRSPGYHTGDHFVMVERSEDLAAAILPLPGDELLVIEYLDAYDRDGNARKYRVMIVDGTIYPLHLALSRNWKVHYFRADMAEFAEHRALDEAFLRDMTSAIGFRAVAALGRIRDVLELDYAGIDFSIDADGNVIVFEANASMIVPKPADDAKWEYRRAPVERIHTAVRDMLMRRASGQRLCVPGPQPPADARGTRRVEVVS